MRNRRQVAWIMQVAAFWALPVLAQQPSQTAAETARLASRAQALLAANCVACHGPALRSSGLLLTSRQALIEGGNRGPAIDLGNPSASVLLTALRQEGDLKMPPGGKLAAEEIEVIANWLEAGAPMESDAEAKAAPGADHWSFQPIERPEPPTPSRPELARNSIDRFVQARLAESGLEPSPETERSTLIRRVALDLTGLPPTPKQIDAFLADDRTDAYQSLVDELLASPHYGERWGRHWLDVAHYADSNGYNIDGAREMWMYRDWVINALNDDMPFDRFVVEQIAGDLLPEATTDQLVATGFHRNTLINLEGGIDFEQYRVEAVVDRVDTVGQAFLGLTLGCARCHDHKFDPISQREFYQFFAFYNSIDELDNSDGEAGRKTAHEPLLEFGSDDELARRDVVRMQMDTLQAEFDAYDKELLATQAEWESALSDEQRAELTDEVRHVLTVPIADRNNYQSKAALRIFREQDLGWTERAASIGALRKRLPKLKSTMVLRELPEPRVTNVMLGGDFLRKGIEVQPGTLRALPATMEEGATPTRLDLGRWLVGDTNPLTARVTVNRVWQRYFGLGLVETENDFGTQGELPSHPRLLDWLAHEFRSNGWSLKDLHRLIVTSHTYRQSSHHRADAAEVDPRNRLLARQNRVRLEAEIVRDAALEAAGLLVDHVGGPSVYPPQPAGASKLGQMQRDWVTDEGEGRYRRGMYTWFWRSSPHPGLMLFDAPDSTDACTRRVRSNTPLQALTLLNDEAHIEAAQALARRVIESAGKAEADRMDYAFQLAVSRLPQPAERDSLGAFLAAQQAAFEAEPETARHAAGGDPELAAWTALSRVLLNLDEFITRE